MSTENTELNYSTIPSYDQIKNKIVAQLSIAENLYSEFCMKKYNNKFKLAQMAIVKLMIAVSDYIYLIDDEEDKKYFTFMLSNPEQLINLNRIGAMLVMCKNIIYKLGITQIEIGRLPTWESFKELE